MMEAGCREFVSPPGILHPASFFCSFSPLMSIREVVITGVGIVSPIGVGREQVWNAIAAKRSGVRALPYLASIGWIAPFGGNVADFDPKELIQPRKSLKVMSREIQ